MNCTLNDKRSFVEHCISIMEDRISNIQRLIKSADEDAKNYGPPKDRYDGYINQQMRRMDMFYKQLEESNHNLDMLKKINLEKIHTDADFGSLIETEKGLYLIVVGLGTIVFDNTKVFVISKSVPIFDSMKGKKIGESFEFNKIKQTIKAIV